MTERDVDRLVQDASIIRKRAKIQATVENARAMMSAEPTGSPGLHHPENCRAGSARLCLSSRIARSTP